MHLSPLTNPRFLYRKPESGQGDQLSILGHAVAATLTAASAVMETWHYAELFTRACLDESPLPLADKIQQYDRMDRAISKYRRTYTSRPAPPLADQSPLRDLPAAELKRPLMMVPGWDMAHDRFLTITEKLTQGGQNGGQTYYIQNGEFYADRDCTAPLASVDVPATAKVFVTVFNQLGESPETSSPQVEANLRALKSVTGAHTPDVMAYSQGGLATRNFLDKSPQSIGKLLMLGTPNQGAGLANLSRFLYDAQDNGYQVDWLMASEHLDADDEASIRFMATDSAQLKDLNSRWSDQMEKTEGFHIVGSAHDPTLHWGWPVVSSGDSMVEKENLAPPGVPTHLVDKGEWTRHRDLPYNAEVYLQAHQHFGW